MARRLDRTAARAGVDVAGRELLGQALRLAMDLRRERELDDHHPDFLHGPRTALILLDDAGVTDAATLAAALLLETRNADLTVPAPDVEHLDPDVARILEQSAPHPEPARRLESLVAADPEARLVATAERLDHARHLHLRPRPEWEPYHRTTCSVYRPVAGRTDPRLEARLQWWCAMFRERYLV